MAKLNILNRFGIAPNELLFDAGITLKAKGLFAYIQAKPDEWDFSAERISDECKESVETIRGVLKELEGKGYLTRRRFQQEGTGFWDMEYTLHQNPTGKKPHTGLPVTGKPAKGKHPNKIKQDSTDSNNTSDNNKSIDNNNSVSASAGSTPKHNVEFDEKLGYKVCRVLQQECRDFYKKHPQLYVGEMYIEFIKWWSEPTKKGVPKWYDMRTWDLGGRLRTWAKKDQEKKEAGVYEKAPRYVNPRDEVNPVVDEKYRMKKI